MRDIWQSDDVGAPGCDTVQAIMQRLHLCDPHGPRPSNGTLTEHHYEVDRPPPLLALQNNTETNDQLCIVDERFRELVSDREGFEWVDDRKPNQQASHTRGHGQARDVRSGTGARLRLSRRLGQLQATAKVR